ncbi:MAG TPA: hypothetical protein VFM20_00485 [Nitrososphaeraceae archaeon]|nr:hypothetical protein [Nitrososphaeraceae archaeon]
MVKLEFQNGTRTESHTIKSDLSFEEICPIWSKKLSQGIDEIDRMILARDSKYCVVGEAWGFTGKQTGYYIAPLIPVVGCWTCIKFGQKFSKAAKDKKCCDNFGPLIKEFSKHWNQKHRRITISRLISKAAQ